MSTNITLIEAKTLSSATPNITFSAIPATYTDLKIVLSARTSGSSDAFLVWFNGSASNLSSKNIQGYGNSVASGGFSGIAGGLPSSSYTANTFGNAEIYISNYTSSNYKSVSLDSVPENNATTTRQVLTAGLWSDTAAITSVTIDGNGDNLVSGSTFYLYGISNVTSTTKATGGIVSSDGTYNYHMFPYSGTFTPTQNITADVLVIAGGGGGGFDESGGGGAGGLLQGTISSLTANTGYTVTIGGGGVGGTAGTRPGTNGSNSVFSTHTSNGGGGGGGAIGAPPAGAGVTGGSGGGASPYAGANSGGVANQGNSSPLTGYGNNGGASTTTGKSGGGGGGAGAVGTAGTSSSGNIGKGGNGLNTWSSWAIATQTGVDNGYYAGGGGGTSGNSTTVTDGGLGGGGKGASSNTAATAGTVNTGGGGGGGNGFGTANGAAGGSGLVIIRYAI